MTPGATSVGKQGPPGPQGPPGKDGSDGKDGQSVSEEKVAAIILQVLQADPDRFKGDQGPPGKDGKDATVNIDELAEAVLRKLPPITVRTVESSTGVVHSTEDVFLGEILNLNHSFETSK